MLHDLRFALRRIRRRPGHALVVVLTLGLGIGASLAVVSVVDAVLLRPLPFRSANRLVAVSQSIPTPGFPDLNFSNIAYNRLRDVPGFESLAAYTQRDANLVHRGTAHRLIVAQVTGNLFDVLQIAPAVGRRFTADEDVRGASRVIVLSDRLWRTVFNADSAVIGSAADLEGEPFTIIGVLPPEVAFPSREIAAWEPLRLDPAAIEPYQNRYTVVGRLRSGASMEATQREATEIVRAVGREYPGPHPGSALDPAGYRANVRSLAEQIVGDVRPVVLLLLAGVSMLLLLTCANVANLQLANAILRGEELSLRAALGATRERLVRSALFEGIALSAAGVIAGVTIAMIGARLFETLFPLAIATGKPLIGGPVLIAAAALVLVVGALIGALPIAAMAGRDPAAGLRDRAAGASPRAAGTARRILAAAQFALAVVLIHSAGLLIASAKEIAREPLGFIPASTMTMRINIPVPTFRNRDAREALLRRLRDEVGAMPGVEAVGLVNALPLTPGRQDLAMAVEGRPFKADGTDPLADYRVASAGYFAAMGIRVVRGRVFTDDDATQTYTPIVISEALAKLLFPDGADPLGQRLRFGPASPWMPIIGVVADAKNRRLTDAPRPELYTPGLGSWSSLGFRTEITIVIRARGDAATLAQPLQRIVAAAAPDVATYDLVSLGDVVRQAGARMMTTTRLMTGYALAAFMLAIAGVYAVLTYLVSQRQHELAVRRALGASAPDILRLVAGESMRVVGAGALAGGLGALLTAQLLSGLLFGVGSFDLVVIAVVVGTAAIAATAAAAVPAVRAVRVDPVASLRGGV